MNPLGPFIERCCEIKENCSYIAQDFDQELYKYSTIPSSIEMSYREPQNEDCIMLGAERFKAPECFFKPDMAGTFKFVPNENI